MLFLILIAVALFAALSYTITSSSRSGTDTISQDKARLAAAQIIQYATALQQATQRLKLINQCSDTQLSYERAPFDGSDVDYYNATSPSNFRCHVFHPDGGGLAYSAGLEEWFDPQFGSDNGPRVVAHTCVRDVGTNGTGNAISTFCDDLSSATDLMYFIGGLKKEICEAINEQLVSDPTIPVDAAFHFNPNVFNGNYGQGREIGALGGALDGQHSYCYQAFDGNGQKLENGYVYYNVLLAR